MKKLLLAVSLLTIHQTAFSTDVIDDKGFQSESHARFQQSHTDKFPNFFRSLKKEDGTYEGDLVEKALGAMIDNTPFAYLDQKTGLPKKQGFYEALDQVITSRVPGARAYICGGVVRSCLGKLYQKMYRQWEKSNFDPDVDYARFVLNEMISREKEINQISTYGFQSDLDILIDFPEKTPKNLREQTIEAADQFINEPRKHFFALDGDFRDILFPEGDVQEYNNLYGTQGRCTVLTQGGATLDWLAFPISGENRQMRMPEGHDDILNSYFEGKLVYAPAENPRVENNIKRAIRGLRPLFDNPFLVLTPDSEERLRSIIKNYRQLTPGAATQIEKLLRNSRLGMAGNRYWGNESFMQFLREKKLFKIPRYLDRQSLSEKQMMNDNASESPFLDPEEFFRSYTQDDAVFHGSPGYTTPFKIMRGGPLPSREHKTGDQGRARFGSGLYAHGVNQKSWCDRYAGEEGLVFPVKLRRDPSLKILFEAEGPGRNFYYQKKNEYIKSQEKETLTFHEYLQKNYGVDIVVSGGTYITILNSYVLKPEWKIGTLYQSALSPLFSSMMYDQLTSMKEAEKLAEKSWFYGAFFGLEATNNDSLSYGKMMMMGQKIKSCSETKKEKLDFLLKTGIGREPGEFLSLLDLQESEIKALATLFEKHIFGSKYFYELKNLIKEKEKFLQEEFVNNVVRLRSLGYEINTQNYEDFFISDDLYQSLVSLREAGIKIDSPKVLTKTQRSRHRGGKFQIEAQDIDNAILIMNRVNPTVRRGDIFLRDVAEAQLSLSEIDLLVALKKLGVRTHHKSYKNLKDLPKALIKTLLKEKENIRSMNLDQLLDFIEENKIQPGSQSS